MSGHGSHEPAPAPGGGGAGLIGAVVIVLGILGLVIYLYATRGGDDDEKEAAAQTAPPRIEYVEVVKKVGKEPKFYRYADYPDRCYREEIQSHDWYWYLRSNKGGATMVHPPKGKPFKDWPGKMVETHIGPGLWRWCQVDPDAIGVEVWQ